MVRRYRRGSRLLFMVRFSPIGREMDAVAVTKVPGSGGCHASPAMCQPRDPLPRRYSFGIRHRFCLSLRDDSPIHADSVVAGECANEGVRGRFCGNAESHLDGFAGSG